MTAPESEAVPSMHNTAILTALNSMVENTEVGHANHAIIDGRMVIAVRNSARLFTWFLDGRPVTRADIVEAFQITHRDGSSITHLGAQP